MTQFRLKSRIKTTDDPSMKMRLSYAVGISSKLILVVTSIIVLAIGSVVYIASDLYLDESSNRIQVNNKDAVYISSQKIVDTFQDTIQRMRLMAQMVTEQDPGSEETKKSIYQVLSGQDHFVTFYAYQINAKNEPELKFSSVVETASSEFDLKPNQLSELPYKALMTKQLAKPEELVLLNSSKFLNRPLFSVSFLSKVEKDKTPGLAGRWIFRSEIRQSALLSALPENKEIISYIIDGQGEVLVHSDVGVSSQVYKGISYATNPVVEKILTSQISNQSLEYDDGEEEYLAAYRNVGVAGLSIIAQVPKSRALATIEQVQYRSFLVMMIVVCLAFVINYSFSQSLTRPLQNLYQATEKIVDGNFDVHLKKTSSDEIGALSVAFNDMATGLKEREKLSTAFHKFHSKDVAKKLLSGEIKLGGERKQATVFFSDIRGFTTMSESLSPDQVVQIINEYMTEMVNIIYKWDGVVDKYVGDAIMAVWGAPESSPRDAYNAVMASLEMRHFLKAFNEKKREEGKQEIKIGIGLHSGDVLAGNIGSEQRLEYTVIGDTVNQASRIEAATKTLQSDLLISQSTYVLVKEFGIEVGPEIPVHAKGKKQAIIVHQVIGYRDEQGKVQSEFSEDEIAQVRKIQVTLLAEEEKTHIMAPAAMAAMPQVEEPRYYVMQNPNSPEQEGPFRLEEIRVKMAAGFYDPRACFVLKVGDAQMQSMMDVMGLNRRSESPPPSPLATKPLDPSVEGAAFANEWYVSGPNGETLGPFTMQQLRDSILNGVMTRTTYVWKTGYPNWIYLHEVPEFNRRAG